MAKNRSIKRSALTAVTAFALGLVATAIVQREPMVRLTRTTLTEARARWEREGPEHYDIRYEFNGGVYEVEVRAGIVHEVLVDGVRPVSADWRNYSVDGLFELLELEVENLSDDAGPFGGRGEAVLAKVRFDEQLGYPVHYLRSGGGPPPAVVRVDAFEAIPN